MPKVRRGLVTAVLGYALVFGAIVALRAAFQPVRVSGGSMRPALVSGDVVLVRKSRQVDAGDVVLMQFPGQGPVLHRAVEEASQGSFITKGDANDIADRLPVPVAHIRGRVVAVAPVGKFIEWWRSR